MGFGSLVVSSTVAGVLASLITILVVSYLKRWSRHWAQRAARQFWSTDDGMVRIVLSESGAPQTTEDARGKGTLEVERRISSHMAMALSRLLTFLPEVGVRVSSIVDPARDNVGSVTEENLVVLGGPLANPLAHTLATDEKVPFPWWWHDPDNPRAICLNPPNKGSSSYYVATIRTEERDGCDCVVEADAGVVAKVRNPWAPGKWIFVMAGNYGAGCHAAVRAATHYWVLDECRREDQRLFDGPLSFVVTAAFGGLDMTSQDLKTRSRVCEAH